MYQKNDQKRFGDEAPAANTTFCVCRRRVPRLSFLPSSMNAWTSWRG